MIKVNVILNNIIWKKYLKNPHRFIDKKVELLNKKNNLYKKNNVTADSRLPGDPDKNALVQSMIRVNQAGEYGAQRIYAGQLAVTKKNSLRKKIQMMADHEKDHLETFNNLMLERKIRPTALQPVWHVLGFALGATTALMGEKSAMACTVAVEEVIDEHYQNQINQIESDEKELRNKIIKFRDDELNHKDIAYNEGATKDGLYSVLDKIIKTGSKIAINISEKV